MNNWKVLVTTVQRAGWEGGVSVHTLVVEYDDRERAIDAVRNIEAAQTVREHRSTEGYLSYSQTGILL
jgi:hypothetical protein